MKQFESFLAPKIEEYLMYRHHLGYSTENSRTYLLIFDRYLTEKKARWDWLHPGFFLTMRKDLTQKPHTANKILFTLRSFFQFLVRQEICKENPLQDIPLLPEPSFIPFVFSPEQIEQLLSTVCRRLRNKEPYFLKDLGVYMVILLLARCGLRISEPLRLLRSHYRSKEGTLYIEKTKFKKDRLIPLPLSVCREMENYLNVRRTLLDNDQNPSLVVRNAYKGLRPEHIYPAFHRAVKDIGLDQPKRSIANTTFGSPTPHSLRHSFAINTLKRIKTQGRSPQHALPVLAAYMGHRKYLYTAVYLKVLDAEHRQGLVNFAVSYGETG